MEETRWRHWGAISISCSKVQKSGSVQLARWINYSEFHLFSASSLSEYLTATKYQNTHLDVIPQPVYTKRPIKYLK